jgi:hypothetical protein
MGEPVSPVLHPVLDTFLLGFICSASLFAGIFFLRFWRETRDPLFLSFAAFFLVQSGLRVATGSLAEPNTGSSLLFLVRMISVLWVLTAIIWKNATH